IGIGGPAILLVGAAGFDAFAPRLPAVLKETVSGDRARDVDDVVGIADAEQAETPVQPAVALAEVEPAAQARLVGMRDHLLQMRVGGEQLVDEARPRWV